MKNEMLESSYMLEDDILADMKLNSIEQRTFDAFCRAIAQNNEKDIKKSMSEMCVVAQNHPDSSEVQFNYYLVLAAIDPQDCVNAYKKNIKNDYCASFCTALAYAKLNDNENSYKILNSLMETEFPKSNISLLDAARNYILGEEEKAIEAFDQVGESITELLLPIRNALNLLLSSYVNKTTRQKTEKENAFVLKNIFNYTGSLAASNAAVDIEKNPEFLKFQKEAKAIIADYEKRALAAEAKLKEYEARASVAEKKAQDLETGSESQKMILKTKVEAMLVKQKTEYENVLAQRRSEYEKLILAARKAQAEAEAKYAALAKKVGRN